MLVGTVIFLRIDESEIVAKFHLIVAEEFCTDAHAHSAVEATKVHFVEICGRSILPTVVVGRSEFLNAKIYVLG